VWVLGGLVCLALAPVQAPWGTHAFVACLIVMGLARWFIRTLFSGG